MLEFWEQCMKVEFAKIIKEKIYLVVNFNASISS
jgi:hypothetical protein